jgi:hypothetical protein
LEAAEQADALVRTTRGIAEAELRVAYVRSLLLDGEVVALAAMLDVVCARAEQAEHPAREALVALVDALRDPSIAHVVQPVSIAPSREVPQPEDDRIPDYGRGRPLTLGERKSLARKPDREMMDRLLRDPHPDVIRQLLANPKLTEDDVLTLAARRPARPDVLTQIARSTKWVHRTRIRMALVLNPDTPLEIAAPLVGLLMRHELRLVATSTTVPPAVRALCLEHLDRRPPSELEAEDDDLLQ